jgi:hypothetical protein
MNVDPASGIVAAAGAFATVAGVWLSRRGQAETHAQQVAVQKVSQDRLELDSWQQLAEANAGDATAQRAENERLHRRIEAERTNWDEREARYVEALATLRGVVLDEAAREAAKDVVPPSPAVAEVEDALKPPRRHQEGRRE